MSLRDRLVRLGFNPLKVIEWVVAICTAAGGLYIISPLYDISVSHNGLSAFAQTLSSTAVVSLWGAVLLIGTGIAIAGLISDKPSLKSIGWFYVVLARLFQILTTWLTVGFLPISWIHPFTVMVIVCVLWLWARYEVNYHGNS